jgi:hypothetical protein
MRQLKDGCLKLRVTNKNVSDSNVFYVQPARTTKDAIPQVV